MNIVTTTSVLPYNRPAETVLKQLKEVGFSYLDLAFDTFGGSTPFYGDNWEDWARQLKQTADENGVAYTHSHAPGDASNRSDAIFRCFKACEILGIRYIVVHPIFKNKENNIIYINKDEFIELNTKAILPLCTAAAEHGVTVLTENLLWGCSASPEIIGELVASVGRDNFGWCFDTGHANACGYSIDEVKKSCVVPLSLHVQDNHGIFWDEHLLPGDGNIDWQHFMRLLKEIDYKGDLVLEAHHQSLEAKTEPERTNILSDLLNRAASMINYSKLI